VTWLQAPYPSHQIECIRYMIRALLRSGPPCTTVSIQGNTCTTQFTSRQHMPQSQQSLRKTATRFAPCPWAIPWLPQVDGSRCCHANNSRLCKCSSKHKCLEASSPGRARQQTNSRLISIDHCQCVIASGGRVCRCVGWCAQPAHTSHIHV
jgi:hypothetical protein